MASLVVDVTEAGGAAASDVTNCCRKRTNCLIIYFVRTFTYLCRFWSSNLRNMLKYFFIWDLKSGTVSWVIPNTNFFVVVDKISTYRIFKCKYSSYIWLIWKEAMTFIFVLFFIFQNPSPSIVCCDDLYNSSGINRSTSFWQAFLIWSDFDWKKFVRVYGIIYELTLAKAREYIPYLIPSVHQKVGVEI